MASKIAQAAAARKTKHVPVEASDLWTKETVPIDDVKNLTRMVGLLYMGMKDLTQWLHELENFVNGGDIQTEDTLMGEVRELRGKVKDLDAKLTAALAEVES